MCFCLLYAGLRLAGYNRHPVLLLALHLNRRNAQQSSSHGLLALVALCMVYPDS